MGLAGLGAITAKPGALRQAFLSHCLYIFRGRTGMAASMPAGQCPFRNLSGCCHIVSSRCQVNAPSGRMPKGGSNGGIQWHRWHGREIPHIGYYLNPHCDPECAGLAHAIRRPIAPAFGVSTTFSILVQIWSVVSTSYAIGFSLIKRGRLCQQIFPYH